MSQLVDHGERLAEIARTTLGELADEAVLHLLAERKKLQELQEQYERLEAEKERVRWQKEGESAQKEIDRLNALITADKPDDELIRLVEERKTWEVKQEEAEHHVGLELKRARTVSGAVEGEPVSSEGMSGERMSFAESDVVGNNEQSDTPYFADVTLDTSSEWYPHLTRIRGAQGSMGRLLEALPVDAKRDKAFMLEIAKIDPLYAMHYADQATLKKDPDFNLRVAVMNNPRGVGSVLSEMLPEARTAQVVMAGIKNDYRNVRFLLPQMEGYGAMLAQAKEEALTEARNSHDGVTILPYPKILEQDKAFMTEIQALRSTGQGLKIKK